MIMVSVFLGEKNIMGSGSGSSFYKAAERNIAESVTDGDSLIISN